MPRLPATLMPLDDLFDHLLSPPFVEALLNQFPSYKIHGTVQLLVRSAFHCLPDDYVQQHSGDVIPMGRALMPLALAQCLLPQPLLF